MKKVVIIGGVLLVVIALGLYYTQVYTKSFSPSATVDFNDGTLKIQVVYCRPYKKGREIFGKLDPSQVLAIPEEYTMFLKPPNS